MPRSIDIQPRARSKLIETARNSTTDPRPPLPSSLFTLRPSLSAEARVSASSMTSTVSIMRRDAPHSPRGTRPREFAHAKGWNKERKRERGREERERRQFSKVRVRDDEFLLVPIPPPLFFRTYRTSRLNGIIFSN